MKKISSQEGNMSSASQNIPRILWNRQVHYRIHNSHPIICIPSHINPAHTPV